MKYFNELTPAELERLAFLAEECGETIQAIGKILRHGYESSHPDRCETNRTDLEEELGHILAAVCLMEKGGDISTNMISGYRDIKSASVLRYLHHQE